jgi:hypothetical protein
MVVTYTILADADSFEFDNAADALNATRTPAFTTAGWRRILRNGHGPFTAEIDIDTDTFTYYCKKCFHAVDPIA